MKPKEIIAKAVAAWEGLPAGVRYEVRSAVITFLSVFASVTLTLLAKMNDPIEFLSASGVLTSAFRAAIKAALGLLAQDAAGNTPTGGIDTTSGTSAS